MEFRQHNFVLDGSDIPVAVGDRQYAQDKARDFWHLKEYATLILEEFLRGTSSNITIRGCVGSQGAGHTLSWTAGAVKLQHTTKSPTNWSALPPTMTGHTIPVFLDVVAASNQAITSATTDGVTVNYAKFEYLESSTSSRVRAKKTGSYDSEVLPAYTFTCDSSAPTATEVCFATFTTDGATLTFTGEEDRFNHSLEYDFVVENNADWQYVIKRVSANTYKIKDGIKSIRFKYLSGGYDISNILLGGDTYGVIQTNETTQIIFDGSAYINVGDTASSMEVDTDDCILENVYIKGTGSSGVSIAQTFLLNANRVIYKNCKVSDRLFSATHAMFKGSGTSAHNITSKYIGCTGFSNDSNSALYMFESCENISDSICYSNSSSNLVMAFNTCKIITNCRAEDLDGDAGVRAFYECNMVNSCYVYNITSTVSGQATGFQGCTEITGCRAQKIDATDNIAYGFVSCYAVSACYAYDIDSASSTTTKHAYGFSGCTVVSGCRAEQISAQSANAYGFSTCNIISACYAVTIRTLAGTINDAFGFASCDQISGCEAILVTSFANDANGFWDCEHISACETTNITASSGTAEGFKGCSFGSSLWTDEPVNSGNDYIDTTDAAITNKFSSHPTNWT